MATNKGQGPDEENADSSGFLYSADLPGQAESRLSKSQLEELLDQNPGEPPAWETLYRDLIEERQPVLDEEGEPVLDKRGLPRTQARWDWRKALYIAWSCVPKAEREPRYERELAADYLGLSSTRTIRQWKERDPEIVERIASGPARMLAAHVADVMAALVAVAASPDTRAHSDRKLFLEMTGHYSPKSALDLTASVDVEGELDIRTQRMIDQVYGLDWEELDGEDGSDGGDDEPEEGE